VAALSALTLLEYRSVLTRRRPNAVGSRVARRQVRTGVRSVGARHELTSRKVVIDIVRSVPLGSTPLAMPSGKFCALVQRRAAIGERPSEIHEPVGAFEGRSDAYRHTHHAVSVAATDSHELVKCLVFFAFQAPGQQGSGVTERNFAGTRIAVASARAHSPSADCRRSGAKGDQRAC